MRPTISLITATFNVAHILPGLIESLREQTDRDFDWIIVDGASTDTTIDLIKSASDIVTQWISEPDFGIYHAINKALHMTQREYYLVIGADDRLDRNAVKYYRNAAEESHADIITAQIIRNGNIESFKRNWPWLYAHHAYVSEHAVGSLIRRSLHDDFGFYSRRYPIGADLLFLKLACSSTKTIVLKKIFVAGVFGSSGISRVDRTGTICDYFRVQLETEKHKYLQLAIFFAKLLWNANNLVNKARHIE